MEQIRREPLVYIPAELKDSGYIGDLWGYYYPDTEIYNILAWDDLKKGIYFQPDLVIIGRITTEEMTRSNSLVGFRTENGISFKKGDVNYHLEVYELQKNIFSRNSGILETDWMQKKSAFISGCGSVGSLVALELARAGVGFFILVDNDVMAYHNICRHQCGIKDVGKYKVNALKERILDINPSANVSTYPNILENLPKDVFDANCSDDTILISCADNREADRYGSEMANIYSIPFVSIGFWERAFAGEIFYFIPTEDMPCYECGVGGQGLSSKVSTNRRFYTNQEDLQKVNFEPGISIDINFVTTVAIKLIVDIYNKNNPLFTPRVINYLTQFTLVCNTNDVKVGGERAEYFAHPLQITSSIKVRYKNSCPPCKFR